MTLSVRFSVLDGTDRSGGVGRVPKALPLPRGTTGEMSLAFVDEVG